MPVDNQFAVAVHDAVTNVETAIKSFRDLWNNNETPLQEEVMAALCNRLIVIADDINNALEGVEMSLCQGWSGLVERVSANLENARRAESLKGV